MTFGSLIPEMPNAVINVNTATTTVIVAAPTSPAFIRVLGWERLAGGTVNVTFKDGTTALEGPMPLAAQAGDVVVDEDGVFDCTPGNALQMTTDAAVQVSGHVKYAIKGA